MATAAERFADWATSVRYEDIPSEVVEHAKDHLLDTLGCGLAASSLGVAGEGRSAMAALGGEGDATVIGGPSMPAANAAFANAMLCHGLDFDDTHSGSVSHVSTVVCPAALAVAEATGASGRELITAIVVGNEIMTRVGMATPGAFHKRGFHPTSICGIFGATAAVGRLYGYDADTITRALGITGSMASGLFAYLEDGTPTKPIHPAWAAHGAILASSLAQFGAIGPKSVFECKFGVYHAFLDLGKVDLAEQLADLGTRWETPNIAYKPYPACHFIHGTLGAAAQAADGRTFSSDEIDEILVTVPAAGVSLVLEPEDKKRLPRSEYEGKFSLQYSTAAMLARGRVGVSDYTDEAISDKSVLDISAKVRYETKEYPTYPQAFPGGVRIKTAGGDVLEAELQYQRGGPDNPMSRDDVLAKYRENSATVLGAGPMQALEAAVLSIDGIDDVQAVLAPLADAAAV